MALIGFGISCRCPLKSRLIFLIYTNDLTNYTNLDFKIFTGNTFCFPMVHYVRKFKAVLREEMNKINIVRPGGRSQNAWTNICSLILEQYSSSSNKFSEARFIYIRLQVSISQILDILIFHELSNLLAFFIMQFLNLLLRVATVKTPQETNSTNAIVITYISMLPNNLCHDKLE